MKVIFIFSGLPHYLIALLNKLAVSYGINICVIIPKKRGMSLGEGVKLTKDYDDHRFSVFQLEEFKGKLNKPYFRNLSRILLELSPDILVIGWPYIINLYLDKAVRQVIRENNISLIYREIPFMVAPRNKAIKYYRRFPVVNENLEVDNPTGLLFFFWAIGLNQIRKRYYRLADATMIYAKHGFQIHESFGISRDKIFLTYNSPDTDMIAEARKRLIERGVRVSNPKRIIHLGRLVKWKRVDLLIEAIALLSHKHPSIELSVIGEGPEEQNLRQYAESNTPEGCVNFLGSIYNLDDLGEEIMTSSIYVLAGMGGLSINESMAFGKPVICSRCDGTEKDLVIEGFNGFFFREGDAADLASKIESLFNDPGRIETMGANSLSIIENKINLETVAQRFMNCFEFLEHKKRSIDE